MTAAAANLITTKLSSLGDFFDTPTNRYITKYVIIIIAKSYPNYARLCNYSYVGSYTDTILVQGCVYEIMVSVNRVFTDIYM